MKNLITTAAAFLMILSASAQRRMLPYSVVLDSFFAKYEPVHYSSMLRIAKKPDGWWVGIVNPESYSNDQAAELLTNHRFWTVSTGRFEILPEAAFSKSTDPESLRRRYLSEEVGEWYNMQRNLYYGYNGWDLDVIAALQRRSDAGMNDTLRESLGRAYDFYATRFGWYQLGGRPLGSDPLQQRRPAGSAVPEGAADSMAHYIRLAAAQYRKIAARHPGYLTKVGAVACKVFCELMHGWYAMEIAGFPKKGKPFLDELRTYLDSNPALAQTIAGIADAYLTACPKNAVLFSYGDMDTYPIWYCQYALGQRRDVAVVNTSLLGLGPYLPWMQQSSGLVLTVKPEVYNDPAFAYVSFQKVLMVEDQGGGKPPVIQSTFKTSVHEFLSSLLTSRFVAHSSDGFYGSHVYNMDTLVVALGGKMQPWHALGYQTEKELVVTLSQHLYLSDLLELDIVAQNLGLRPILYTTNTERRFERNLFPLGMGYQLIPADVDSGRNPAIATAVIMDYLYKHPVNLSTPVSASFTAAPENFYPLFAACAFAGGYFADSGKKPELDTIAGRILQFAKASAAGYPMGTIYSGAWLMQHGYYAPELKGFLEQALRALTEADSRRDDALDANPGGESLVRRYAAGLGGLYETAGWNTDELRKVLESKE